MRLSVAILLMLGLSGCANYAGMHEDATYYQQADLAKRHVYYVPKKAIAASERHWWGHFQDPQLDQLISVALAKSPTMHIAASRIKRSEQLAGGAESQLWPTINASADYYRERFSQYGLVPPPYNGQTYNIGEFGVSFNYELDFWGKHREALAAMKDATMAAKVDAAEARLVLASAVASCYYQLIGSMKQLQTAQAILHQRQEMQDIIGIRAKRGIVSDIPLETIRTNVQMAKMRVEQYKQLTSLLQHKLAVLLGDNPFTTEIKTGKFVYRAEPLHLPAVVSLNVLSQRPDVAAACFRALASSHEVKSAKALFFPNINLTALYSHQSLVFDHLFSAASQNNLGGAAIDLPLFDAGARRANLGVKYADYDLAVSTYNQTLLVALHEVADQMTRLKTLKVQLPAQHQAFLAAKNNYQIARERYHHGMIDYQQVLVMQAAYLEQETAEIDYQTRHLLTMVGLMKALGGDYQARAA